MNSLAEAHRGREASYVAYFDFLEVPFPDGPGPRFEVGTPSRARVFEGIRSGVKRREALIVVTGGEGTGKTTLCLTLPRHFGPRTFASVIVSAPATPDDLLTQMLVDFGLSDPRRPVGVSSRDDQHIALQGFFRSLAPVQGQAVVVLDHAHALSVGVLEEILRLTNFQEIHPGLLQIVLVGQPALLDVMQQPGVDRLHDRVARRHTLPPLTDSEVGQYIERQIWIARGGVAALPAVTGADGSVPGVHRGLGPRFTPSAIDTVVGSSSGSPRSINAICDRALAMACDGATDRITGRMARRAAVDLGLPKDARRRWRLSPKAAGVMIATLAAGALVSASWPDRWPLHSATAGEAPRPTPDRSFDELRTEALRLGTSLSVEPDVKGLLKLRDELQLWDVNSKYARHEAVNVLLDDIERLTNEARKRQLDMDRALLLDAGRKHAP